MNGSKVGGVSPLIGGLPSLGALPLMFHGKLISIGEDAGLQIEACAV